jgi:hypothetical protein
MFHSLLNIHGKLFSEYHKRLGNKAKVGKKERKVRQA